MNESIMKNMLIIHPHWPPSNTVGVHRVRLIANELHSLGWKATVLTIDERDYEEDLAYETLQLIDKTVEVVKVRARPVVKILGKRMIGDIGLRGFSALKKQAHQILSERAIDFIWFSLPSWYTPLMGAPLKKRYNVNFGVDYRDPWVYKLATHQKGLNRATATVLTARVLEPLALREVSLISGVSEGYLKGIHERQAKLKHTAKLTFQMGFRKEDHTIHLEDFSPPFTKEVRTYVYAGAYSPNWYPIFRLWMKGLAALHSEQSIHKVQFMFIGTRNPELQSITELADEFNVGELVNELPDRIPFLQVQQILRESDGAIILGSTERHYSASKLFQCLVTAPRVFAFFHEASEGAQILRDCEASNFYVGFSEHLSEVELIRNLKQQIASFIDPTVPWKPKMEVLNAHSSHANAKRFIAAIDQLTQTK